LTFLIAALPTASAHDKAVMKNFNQLLQQNNFLNLADFTPNAAGGVLMRTAPGALVTQIQTLMAPQSSSAPKCVNIPRNQRSNRNPLWQYTCDGTSAEQWDLRNWTPAKTGEYGS
jgi:hypothetical protein